MANFLFICAFLVGVVAASDVDLSHHGHEFNKYENITMGESGIKCTRQRRKCLSYAACVNYQCYCPQNQKGEATIECVEQDEHLCYLSGDPHVVAYGKSKVDVNIPCRYRASRYVTTYPTSVAGLGDCGFEIFATNELFRGRYVIRSVHISLGITDHVQQVHDKFEYYKSYDVRDEDVYKFFTNVSSSRSVWGSAVHEEIAGVNVYPVFEETDNFAVLKSTECELRVKFRPLHPGRRFQDQLFGLTIMAPPHSTFVPGYGSYPDTLCGTPNDKATLYQDRAKELGISSASRAIIYDIAHQRPLQTGNPKAEQCYRLFDKITGATNAVELLNEGGFILDSLHVSRCLQNNNLDPLDVFNAFLSYKTSATKDVAACNQLQSAASLCAKSWTGVKTYNC